MSVKLAGHRQLTVMITSDLWGQIHKPQALSRLKYNKTKKVPLPGILVKGSRMFVIKDRKQTNSKSGREPNTVLCFLIFSEPKRTCGDAERSQVNQFLKAL